MYKSVIFLFCFTPFLMDISKNDELAKSMLRGKEIYIEFCIKCHSGNGQGTGIIIPPLAKSDYLMKYRKESIRSVKYGQSGKIIVNGIEYNATMPSAYLEDEEVADVMNYILNSWGSSSKNIVTAQEVKAILK